MGRAADVAHPGDGGAGRKVSDAGAGPVAGSSSRPSAALVTGNDETLRCGDRGRVPPTVAEASW